MVEIHNAKFGIDHPSLGLTDADNWGHFTSVSPEIPRDRATIRNGYAPIMASIDRMKHPDRVYDKLAKLEEKLIKRTGHPIETVRLTPYSEVAELINKSLGGNVVTGNVSIKLAREMLASK